MSCITCICLRAEDFELCIKKVSEQLVEKYPHLSPHRPEDDTALAAAYLAISTEMFREAKKQEPALKRPDFACCWKRARVQLQAAMPLPTSSSTKEEPFHV